MFVFQKEDMVQLVAEGLVTPQRRGLIRQNKDLKLERGAVYELLCVHL